MPLKDQVKAREASRLRMQRHRSKDVTPVVTPDKDVTPSRLKDVTPSMLRPRNVTPDVTPKMLTRPNGEPYNPAELLSDGRARYLGPFHDGQVLDRLTV